MIWLNEAVHVARKDVRHARALLLVYAIIVVIALLAAMALPVQTDNTTLLTGSGVVLLFFGMIMAASAIQADSPTQSNAFWASRPFHPTAMLGAKILYCAIVIVGIPLVAELIGLAHFQASTATMLGDLARSSAIYGVLLLGTIVIASLTSDLRGFIVGALAVLIGIVTIVAAVTISNIQSRFRPLSALFDLISSWGLNVVAVLGSLALLVWLYRRRDVSRVAWIGAVIVVGACIAVFVDIGGSEPDVRVSKAAADLPPIVFDQATISPRPNGAPALRLQFALAPQAMRRTTLTIRAVNVRLRDGSVVDGQPNWEPMTFDNPASVLPAGVQPFGSQSGASTIATTISLRDEDRARLERVGIAGVDVKATASVSQAQQIAAGTFGASSSKSVAGTRVEIGPGRIPKSRFSLEVLTASVENARNIVNPPTSVVVVNERQREGIVLDSQRYAMSSSWMVLPGAPLWTARISFNALRPRESNTNLRAVSNDGSIGEPLIVETNVSVSTDRFPELGWYDGAKIAVVQWTPRSSQEIRLSKTMN